MLVKDLQQELKKRGLDTKGLKADLLKRLEEAVAQETSNQPSDATKATTDEVKELFVVAAMYFMLNVSPFYSETLSLMLLIPFTPSSFFCL